MELHIYGTINDAESKQYKETLIKSASGYNNIYFHDEVNDQNRLQVYNNIGIVAVPSLWFENLPFVISETFSAGIPVLASDIAGIDELVDHNKNGILIRTGDINSWSESIDEIIENPEIIQNLSLGIPDVKLSAEASSETSILFRKILAEYYN